MKKNKHTEISNVWPIQTFEPIQIWKHKKKHTLNILDCLLHYKLLIDLWFSSLGFMFIRPHVMGYSMVIEFYQVPPGTLPRVHRVSNEYVPSSYRVTHPPPTPPPCNGHFLKIWPFKRSFFPFLITFGHMIILYRRCIDDDVGDEGDDTKKVQFVSALDIYIIV